VSLIFSSTWKQKLYRRYKPLTKYSSRDTIPLKEISVYQEKRGRHETMNDKENVTQGNESF
jgi:hypothetical protein